MFFRILILLIFACESLQYYDEYEYAAHEYGNYFHDEYVTDTERIKPSKDIIKPATPLLRYNDIDETLRKIMAGRTFFSVPITTIENTKYYENYRNHTIHNFAYKKTESKSRKRVQSTPEHVNKKTRIKNSRKAMQKSKKRNIKTTKTVNKKTKINKEKSNIKNKTKKVEQVKSKERALRSHDKKSKNNKKTREEHPLRSTYTAFGKPFRSSVRELIISRSNPNHGKPSRSSKKPTKSKKKENESWEIQIENWTPLNKSKDSTNKGRTESNLFFIRPSRSMKTQEHKSSRVFESNRQSSRVIGSPKKLQTNMSLIPTLTTKKITPARSKLKYNIFDDYNLFFDTTVTDIFPKPEDSVYADIILTTATTPIFYAFTRSLQKEKTKSKSSLGITRTKQIHYPHRPSYHGSETGLIRYPERLSYYDGKSSGRMTWKKGSPMRPNIRKFIYLPKQIKGKQTPIRSTLRNVTHTSLITFTHPARSSTINQPKRTQSKRKGSKKQSVSKIYETDSELYEPNKAMAQLKFIIQANRAKIAKTLKSGKTSITIQMSETTHVESYYNKKTYNTIRRVHNRYPSNILERVTPMFQALQERTTKLLDSEEAGTNDVYLMWGDQKTDINTYVQAEIAVEREGAQEQAETEKQEQKELNKIQTPTNTNLLREREETSDMEAIITETQINGKTELFGDGGETLSTVFIQATGANIQQTDSATNVTYYDWNKKEGDVNTNKQIDSGQLPSTDDDDDETETTMLLPYLETQPEREDTSTTETGETNIQFYLFFTKSILTSTATTVNTIDKIERQALDDDTSSIESSSSDNNITTTEKKDNTTAKQESTTTMEVFTTTMEEPTTTTQKSTTTTEKTSPTEDKTDTTGTMSKRTRTKGFDVDMFLELLANLTYDYDTNLTMVMNMTLKERGAPTCGTPRGWYAWMGWPNFTWPTTSTTTTTEPYIELPKSLNNTVIAKCFVCGLKERGIPYSSDCADAFAGDFLPLVPINPIAKAYASSYRKYCRYGEIYNYHENVTRPKSIYGRWTGGCSVRWTDLTGLYTQRACRNRHRPTTGEHYASKRMAKLEYALSSMEDGCIITPAATLLPISRGVSLYSRFHACVCSGSWCNMAVTLLPHVAVSAVTAVAIAGIWATLVKPG